MRNPSPKRRHPAGFTLVEMTLAMMLSLIVAGVTLSMISQHVSFLRIINRFQFLRDEAPQINLLLSRVFGHADSYRIFSTRDDAFAGTGAVNTGGTAVWLRFQNPDGSSEEVVIAFETIDGEGQLNYYNRANLWGTSPDWTISSQVSQVSFDNDTGILLITLTGPNGSEITYGGSDE